MYEEDVFFFAVWSIGALFVWGKYYFNLFFIRSAGSKANKLGLVILPLLSAAALYAILKSFASFDVKDSPAYLSFYMMMGAAWTGIAQRFFDYLGVSVRWDVLERNNTAALWVVGGGMIGATLTFAGANIGDGPGWWVVFFCALLATLTLFLLWIFVERFNHLSEAVTVDRDEASGFRMGGFLLAVSIILGRGAAGNWVSTEEAVSMFVQTTWPSLLLVIAAVFMDRIYRPTPQSPHPNFITAGVFPAVVYIGSAMVYVISRGSW